MLQGPQATCWLSILTREPYGTFMVESVNTHEIQNGDTLYVHGIMFKASERTDHGLTPGHTEEHHGSVITFKLDMIGDYPEGHTIMPRHWVEGEGDRYNLQGNRLATWLRVVE